MERGLHLGVLPLVIAVAVSPAYAGGDDGDSFALALSVEAAGGAEPWRASALEVALAESLAEHPRLERGDEAEGLEVLEVRARLRPGRLDLATSIGGVPRARGSIDVNGAGLVEVQRALNDHVAPLLRVDTAAPEPPAPATRRDPSPLALAMVAALFAAPVLFGLIAVGRGGLRLRGPLACGGVLAALIGAAVAPLPGWLVGIAGGAAWCGFALAAGRQVAPPMIGFSWVEPANVFRLIRVQLSAVVRRSIAAAAIAVPVVALCWLGGGSLGVDRYTALALLAPLFGLALLVWLAAVAEVCAALCDRQVSGEVSADNPWHRAARGYLLGTLRRLGVELELPPDLLILPTPGDRVELWGGGLARGRVGVGVELLEFALAPVHRPHDYAEPREERLHWSEWNTGLVMPGAGRERGVLLAKLQAIDRRKSGVFEADYEETEIVALGQPRTLAGFVEPSALDNKLDFRPAEDPTWLDWDPFGDDDEGVDPNDRDFLAAAVAREVINLQRGLGLWRSIAKTIGDRLRGRVAAVAGWPIRALLGASEARVADACVKLHDLGHPLVQHLSRPLIKADQRLTAQGSAPELERRSREITAAVAAAEIDRPLEPLRERLLWLASLSAPVEPSRRARWVRRGVVAAVALGAFAAAGAAVIRAIEYHPTYIEETRDERNESKQGNR